MDERELSVNEAELYDRQIRLWGIESQEKLRASNVLLIGVRGLGSEIAKNIILSGVNSLTFLDSGTVTEEELRKNFLLGRDTLGTNIAQAVRTKAQALNPLVNIEIDAEQLAEKSEKYFNQFTIIVATGLKTKQIVHIDNICRKLSVQFICGDVFGMFGYSLADFQEHDFYIDQVKLPHHKRTHDGKAVSASSETLTVKVHQKLSYPSIHEVLPTSEKCKVVPEGKRKKRNELYYLVRLLLQFRDQNDRDASYSSKEDDLKQLIKLREKILKKYQLGEEKLPIDMLHLVFDEVAPVCACLGGVIAQEVIKAVSHKEVPIHNMFLFNPSTYCGKEEIIGA